MSSRRSWSGSALIRAASESTFECRRMALGRAAATERWHGVGADWCHMRGVRNGTCPSSTFANNGSAGDIGSQLMAVVAEGNRQRDYLAPTDDQVAAAEVDRPRTFRSAGYIADNPGVLACRRTG